jgi:hypothetical protein
MAESFPPEARKHMGVPVGWSAFGYGLHSPLKALPVEETFFEEVAINGAVFRIIAGPGYAIRVERERQGIVLSASASLASLAGTRVLAFILQWSEADAAIQIQVSSPERPGVVVKGQVGELPPSPR